MNQNKIAIITGITGQDGSYLADFLLKKNYRIIGTSREITINKLNNLKYLGIKDLITLETCDLTSSKEAVRIIEKYKPTEVYNLTGQSSVSFSFEDPILSVTSNILPTLNLLEAIRKTDKNIKYYQASSSDMFGKVERLPVDENSSFNPVSPYAISKFSSHLIVENYRESFGLFAVSGILFNHESYLRENNFFVKKIITQALAVSEGKQDFIKVGNIDVKRDFGFAPEDVKTMWLMIQHDKPEDFLICSGKSILLRDIVEYIFKKFNLSMDKLVEDRSLIRPTDIFDIYGNNTKAKEKLNWNYELDFFKVLDIIIDEELMTKKKFNEYENNN